MSGFKVNDIPDSSYRLIPDATKPAVIKYKPESVTADTGGWEAF
ncbi:hypothetical protein [Methylobacter tundripaludum]|nr:hypothetical protein [Methylobacter tundripaludum]